MQLRTSFSPVLSYQEIFKSKNIAVTGTNRVNIILSNPLHYMGEMSKKQQGSCDVVTGGSFTIVATIWKYINMVYTLSKLTN